MSQMTLYSSAHILHQSQVKSVCVLVLLYIPLSMMDIPGPCKHSITKDHLLQINHLINNQLRNGCSISYMFIEQRHLSSVCYVKAALPRVLDLLSVHFRYSQGSDSAQSVRSLQNLIHDIYSQRCVPPLNEELEEGINMCRVHRVPKMVPKPLQLWFTTFNASTIKWVHSKQQNYLKKTWCQKLLGEMTDVKRNLLFGAILQPDECQEVFASGSSTCITLTSLTESQDSATLKHEAPVVFLKQFTDSPVQALQRATEVLEIYLQLITQTHTTVNWSCTMEYSNYTTVVITELPSTHSTEATLVMLEPNKQDSSDSSFYKPGFITVLAVSGGIFLLISVSCLIHRKRFRQPRRRDMDLDTWSNISHVDLCSTGFNRMDLII